MSPVQPATGASLLDSISPDGWKITVSLEARRLRPALLATRDSTSPALQETAAAVVMQDSISLDAWETTAALVTLG
jgi:hypothetical protein